MNAPVATKMVNALVKDAEIGFAAKYLASAVGAGAAENVLNGFKKAMGGLWVGGTATLYDASVAFRPNLINRAVHAGDYSIDIPLEDVVDVQVRSGWFTKIIDVVTANGTLTIRCYGAPRFADAIREQQRNAAGG